MPRLRWRPLHGGPPELVRKLPRQRDRARPAVTVRRSSKKMAKVLRDRKAFRTAVLERSKGFCDRCGTWHGERLHAHHYRPRSLATNNNPILPMALVGILPPSPRHRTFSSDGNGIALCLKCHDNVHMRRGEAARWIDSHNRSLALGAGAPPTGGRRATSKGEHG